MTGPILKDAQYYTFWTVALALYLTSQAAVVSLLWAILREVRK
jgi:hypothetical protein